MRVIAKYLIVRPPFPMRWVFIYICEICWLQEWVSSPDPRGRDASWDCDLQMSGWLLSGPILGSVRYFELALDQCGLGRSPPLCGREGIMGIFEVSFVYLGPHAVIFLQ